MVVIKVPPGMKLTMMPPEHCDMPPNAWDTTIHDSKHKPDDLKTSGERKRRKTAWNDIVKLVALPSNKTVQVHRDLLVGVSSYFEAALKGNFIEGCTREVRLEDTKAEILELFTFWLYRGCLVGIDEEATDRNVLPTSLLFELYTFGDARVIPTLQNFVVDTHIHRYNCSGMGHFGPELQRLYDNSPENSPLVRLVIDIFCASRNSQRMVDQLKDMKSRDLFSCDLLLDVLIASKDESPKPSSSWHWVTSRCKYHIHEDSKTKCPPEQFHLDYAKGLYPSPRHYLEELRGENW